MNNKEIKDKYPEVLYEFEGKKLPLEVEVRNNENMSWRNELLIATIPYNSTYKYLSCDKQGLLTTWKHARLIRPEPSQGFWDDVPAWANFVAMDEDGSWFWFNRKPIIGPAGWTCDGLLDNIPYEYYPKIEVDSKDSLFERPKSK